MAAADKPVPVPGLKDVEIGSENAAEIHIDLAVQRRTLRRFDFFILPQIMIISIIGYMDRSNMGTWGSVCDGIPPGFLLSEWPQVTPGYLASRKARG